MNIFEKIFSFQIICKSRIKLCFHVFTINLFTIAETARKSELSYKIGVCFLFFLLHKYCCFVTDNLLRLTKLVKCIPGF